MFNSNFYVVNLLKISPLYFCHILISFLNKPLANISKFKKKRHFTLLNQIQHIPHETPIPIYPYFSVRISGT